MKPVAKISIDKFKDIISHHYKTNEANKFLISIDDDKNNQSKELFSEGILEEQDLNDHENRDILIRSKIIKGELSFQDNVGFAQNFKSMPGYDRWVSEQIDPEELLNAFVKQGNSFYLVPDTNFILDYAYSNYLAIFSHKNSNLHINVPRTTIWEIENMATIAKRIS